MKYLILLLTISANYLFAQAPSYSNFEWEIVKVGYANAHGLPDAKNGFHGGMEVRFNWKDDLSVGFQNAFSFYISNLDADAEDFELDLIRIQSLTADKYFSTTSANRAFAGLGAGLYRHERSVVRGGDEIATVSSRALGFAPRVGYEFGHGRLLAEYHITTSSAVSNKFSITLGLTLWGAYNPADDERLNEEF